MNDGESVELSKRPVARPFLIWLFVLAAIPVGVFYRTKPRPTPGNLVALGTNAPRLGTAIYHPHSPRFGGEVIETESGPLLEEYWFDAPDEAQKACARLTQGW